MPAAVTLCLLAGGEGRRMGGQDKGLVSHRGEPLARAVLQRLVPQTGAWMISANRNEAAYVEMLHEATGAILRPDVSTADVFRDAQDLPPRSGPLAGILTALRRLDGEWLQCAPCDTPDLPADLVQRLLAAAQQTGADIVVPQTADALDAPRPHWVCALMHRRVLPSLEAQFAAGERKVSRWVCTQPWRSVFFAEGDAFANFNTLETPHASR